MIRELRKADINKVADIWLDTNIKTHYFISAEMQSQGIGKILLNYVKRKRNKLLLNVYQKNTRAISFYKREGFEIQCNSIDEATGERDYVMAWQRK